MATRGRLHRRVGRKSPRPRQQAFLCLLLFLVVGLASQAWGTTGAGAGTSVSQRGLAKGLPRTADNPPIPLHNEVCQVSCCVDGLWFTLTNPNRGWMGVAVNPPSGDDYDLFMYRYKDPQELPFVYSVLRIGTDFVIGYSDPPIGVPIYPLVTNPSNSLFDYVIEWTSETGRLTVGTEVGGTMGGGSGNCGLLRVYGVNLDAGQAYRLSIDTEGADIRACVFPPDPWSTRSQALVEVQYGSPSLFTPTAGGDYGIAVFNNAPGNQSAAFHLRVDAHPTGVGDADAVFTLRPANPVVGAATVRFSLASGSPARLAVHDVTGRRVVAREVGSSGPGWHTIQLGKLPAGVYVVRLTQMGRTLSSRLTILR